MATVDVTVNGQSYALGCADGQEAQIRKLAEGVDGTVRTVAEQVGSIGEARIMLMAALVQADELADARDRVRRLQAEVGAARELLGKVETRAAAALDAAARRVEELSGKVGG